MKKLKELEKTLEFGVFNDYQIKIVRSSNIGESLKKRGLTGPGIDHDEFTGAMTVRTNGFKSWMFFPWSKVTYGDIAHESWHAVKAMADFVGISAKEHETFGYLLGYVVNNTVIVLKGKG